MNAKFILVMMLMMTSTVLSQNINQTGLDSQNGEISEHVEHEIILQGNDLTMVNSGAGFTEVSADSETNFEAIDRAKGSDTTTTEVWSTEETTSDPNECRLVNLTMELDDENILTLTWTISHAWPHICNITHIDIKVAPIECATCATASVSRLPISNLQHTFANTNLDACVLYEFRINETDRSTVQEFRTKERFEKVNFIVQNDNVNVTRVLWNDTEHLHCDKWFQVGVYGNNGKSEKQSSTSEVIFEGLEPCVEYEVIIYPLMNNSIVQAYKSRSFTTIPPILPTGIRNLSLVHIRDEDLVDSIRVTWVEPTDGRRCIVSYDIEVTSAIELDQRARMQGGVTLLEQTVPKVASCNAYTIRLSANTFQNMSGAGVEKEIQIPPRAFLQPTAPIAQSTTENSLTLATSVNNTREMNFCLVARTEFSCIDSDNKTFNQNTDLATDKLSATITSLRAYTYYNCSAKVSTKYNFFYLSSPVTEVRRFQTGQGVPDPPTITAITNSDIACEIHWDPPKNPEGEIISYNVFITFTRFTYSRPESCSNDFERTHERLLPVGGGNNYTFRGALPYAEYSVQVNARNAGERISQYAKDNCYTLPSASEEVRDFQFIRKKQLLHEKYNRTSIFSWKLPCQQNGRIEKFVIDCRSLNDNDHWTRNIDVTDSESYTFINDSLVPEAKYNVSIKAVSQNVLGKALYKTCEIEAGLPELTALDTIEIEADTSTKISQLKIEPYTALFTSDVGKITQIALLIAELDCGKEVERASGFLINETRARSWSDVENEECRSQYRTTMLLPDAVKSTQTLTIGTETICDSYNYCNGPLKPNSKFALTLRLYTNMGYADSRSYDIVTESEIPILFILIFILTTMCTVFAIGFYISFSRTKALREKTDMLQHDNKDIPIEDFAIFYKDLAENNNEKIREEYNAIQTFADKLDKTCIASRANEKLNRYSNISPFDYNRVVLNADEFENDYVNASFIDGYHYAKEYIAAQGPKPNTAHDFWRMILQHNIESIIMLTSLVENNKIKCHEYFPKLNGQIIFANIKITCRIEQTYASYIRRVLDVEKDDVRLTVKHYYFTVWPDHGVPSNALCLIEFCKRIRGERPKTGDTIVVHCSAGVGRTGTFIALDILMQRMKQERRINIFDLVKQLREQRMKMVQSVDQYILLYSSVLTLVETRKRQPQVLQDLMSFFNKIKSGSSNTNRTPLTNHANDVNQHAESTL